MSMCLTVNMSLKRTIAENESSSRVCTSTVSKKPFSGKEREEEERKYSAPGGGGGGVGRLGLGPRNDVFTTCKAVTPRGGQRIIAVFFPQ